MAKTRDKKPFSISGDSGAWVLADVIEEKVVSKVIGSTGGIYCEISVISPVKTTLPVVEEILGVDKGTVKIRGRL